MKSTPSSYELNLHHSRAPSSLKKASSRRKVMTLGRWQQRERDISSMEKFMPPLRAFPCQPQKNTFNAGFGLSGWRQEQMELVTKRAVRVRMPPPAAFTINVIGSLHIREPIFPENSQPALPAPSPKNWPKRPGIRRGSIPKQRAASSPRPQTAFSSPPSPFHVDFHEDSLTDNERLWNYGEQILQEEEPNICIPRLTSSLSTSLHSGQGSANNSLESPTNQQPKTMPEEQADKLTVSFAGSQVTLEISEGTTHTKSGASIQWSALVPQELHGSFSYKTGASIQCSSSFLKKQRSRTKFPGLVVVENGKDNSLNGIDTTQERLRAKSPSIMRHAAHKQISFSSRESARTVSATVPRVKSIQEENEASTMSFSSNQSKRSGKSPRAAARTFSNSKESFAPFKSTEFTSSVDISEKTNEMSSETDNDPVQPTKPNITNPEADIFAWREWEKSLVERFGTDCASVLEALAAEGKQHLHWMHCDICNHSVNRTDSSALPASKSNEKYKEPTSVSKTETDESTEHQLKHSHHSIPAFEAELCVSTDELLLSLDIPKSPPKTPLRVPNRPKNPLLSNEEKILCEALEMLNLKEKAVSSLSKRYGKRLNFRPMGTTVVILPLQILLTPDIPTLHEVLNCAIIVKMNLLAEQFEDLAAVITDMALVALANEGYCADGPLDMRLLYFQPGVMKWNPLGSQKDWVDAQNYVHSVGAGTVLLSYTMVQRKDACLQTTAHIQKAHSVRPSTPAETTEKKRYLAQKMMLQLRNGRPRSRNGLRMPILKKPIYFGSPALNTKGLWNTS